MQRITITLDDELMDDLDRMIAEHGYQNRSEAIRDFTRAGMQQAAQKMGKAGECVAALVYVYDHAARDLSFLLLEQAQILDGELPEDPAGFASRLNQLVLRGLANKHD